MHIVRPLNVSDYRRWTLARWGGSFAYDPRELLTGDASVPTVDMHDYHLDTYSFLTTRQHAQ